MDDDGLSMRRRLAFSIAGALIIALALLLLPARTVSYEQQPEYNHPVQPDQISPKTAENDSIELEVTTDEPMIPVYGAEIERILHAIALCESQDRHFDEDGSVLMNKHGSSATGRFQLMASIWRPVAESMGINIDTEAGNKQMAYYILTEAQGIVAWAASATCLAKHNVFIN